MRMHKPKSMLEEKSELAVAALVAPIAGMAGAFAMTVSLKNKQEKIDDQQDVDQENIDQENIDHDDTGQEDNNNE